MGYTTLHINKIELIVFIALLHNFYSSVNIYFWLCLLSRLGSAIALSPFGSLSALWFSKWVGAPLEEMVCEGHGTLGTLSPGQVGREPRGEEVKGKLASGLCLPSSTNQDKSVRGSLPCLRTLVVGWFVECFCYICMTNIFFIFGVPCNNFHQLSHLFLCQLPFFKKSYCLIIASFSLSGVINTQHL